MKQKIMLLLFILFGTVISSKAQSIGPQTLNASGGGAGIGSNTYDYSIGEMTVVNTATGSNIIVTQGLLQPTPQVTGIDEHAFFADNFKVYPNPSDNIVFMQPAFNQGGELSYQLYDVLGRVLFTKMVTLATGKEKQSFSLNTLAASSYLLSVTYQQKGTLYKTSYKIQKIK